MKLAIFKVNQLGDNVVFLPIVQTLRRMHPEWDLFLFTSPVAAELFRADLSPEQMQVVPTAEFNGAWKRPAILTRLFSRAWKERFDASLVGEDQGNVAHLLARLAGGKIRVGRPQHFIKMPGGLTDEVRTAATLSIPQVNWEIARTLVQRLGGKTWPATPPPPDLSHLAGGAAPVAGRIVIHSGASAAFKRWFPERFEELANRLAEHFEVIWVEQPHTQAAHLSAKVQRAAPQSLGDFVTLLRTASLLVGNNSGPMNIAAALGCPAVIISGSSNPVWDPIWHSERFRILRDTSLPCLPCEAPGLTVSSCRNLAAPLACMAAWSVDEIHRQSVAWIEKWAGVMKAAPAGPA